MTWHVGQRVVCVNVTDSFMPENLRGNINGLEKGRVYTIRKIGTENHFGFKLNALWLEEIVRTCPVKGISDMGSHEKRFRPIDESKIDCLREHLTKVPKSVKEDA